MGDLVVSLLLHYPGAFIRWGLTGFKSGKFKELIKSEAMYGNMVVAIIFGVTLILIIKF